MTPNMGSLRLPLLTLLLLWFRSILFRMQGLSLTKRVYCAKYLCLLCSGVERPISVFPHNTDSESHYITTLGLKTDLYKLHTFLIGLHKPLQFTNMGLIPLLHGHNPIIHALFLISLASSLVAFPISPLTVYTAVKWSYSACAAFQQPLHCHICCTFATYEACLRPFLLLL